VWRVDYFVLEDVNEGHCVFVEALLFEVCERIARAGGSRDVPNVEAAFVLGGFEEFALSDGWELDKRILLAFGVEGKVVVGREQFGWLSLQEGEDD
jgi:hypothetical protein